MITSLSNFTNATLETDILIITLDDNLTHTYCSKISWEKDNSLPMGMAKLTMPYSESIEKYWSTYSGTVIIHANLNNHQKPVLKKTLKTPKKSTSKITKEKEKEKNKIHIQNNEYNYSFIGKVHRFKQIGKTYIIYLEDLGWKFMQKVPDKFRKSYIAGQTLDDAFQAICEFMGVDFAYSLEGLNTYNFAADGYSIEKDGTIIEDTPSILEEFNKTDSQTEEEQKTETTKDEQMANALKDNQTLETSGLIEYEEKNKKTDITETAKGTEKALNQLTTNQRDNTSNNESTIQEDTSKIEKYEEEFNEKIEDLFKGNTLYDSNVSDPILNYNWITIQPKAVSANASNVSGGALGGTSNSGNNADGSDDSSVDSTFGNTSSRARERNGWINGQYYIDGKIYLSKEYINTLSPEAARQKRTGAYGKNTYTEDTMQKLLWRSFGQVLK